MDSLEKHLLQRRAKALQTADVGMALCTPWTNGANRSTWCPHPLSVPRNCPLKFPVLQPTSDQMVGRCLIMPIFMVGVCPGHPPSDMRVLCTPSQEPQDHTGLAVGEKLGPGLSVTSNQTEPQTPRHQHRGCGGGKQSHASPLTSPCECLDGVCS